MQKPGAPLTTGRKLAFAVCDIFGGGSFNIVNFLYPGFLAITVGLSAYHISLVMLIARVWDAISDPLMGCISDATRNRRFGKRRVYLVAAAPLIVLSLFLMFYPYSFSSVGLRFIAVLLSYLLFCTVQTMVMIPYYSLSSEISTDYQQRASANSVRLAFSIFSSILCVAAPGMIVDAFEGGRGYIVMSLIFGVIFGASVLTTGLFAREEIVTPPIKTKMDIRGWGRFFKIKPFRQYLGMFLCLQMTMSIMSTLFFFYVDYCLRPEQTAAGQGTMLGTLAAALMFGMQIVALPVYLKLIAKKGKPFVYRFGSALWVVSALCVLLTGPQTPDWAVYLLAAVMGFGISAPGLVPHTMFGDVADAIELAEGARTEGTISGIVNFLNKVVQGVGLAAVMALLGACGFTETQYADGQKIVMLSQPDTARQAILWLLALAPLVLMTIGSAISLRYRITHEKQRSISALLHGADDASTRAELLKDIKG